MRDSFWGLIWQSFLEINGILLGFLGVIVSLITWSFLLKTQISLNLVVIVFIFLVIMIITLLEAVYKAFKQSKKLESEINKLQEYNQELELAIHRRIIPKIVYVKKEETTGFILCLLEKSDLFATDLVISIFYTDEYGFEALIGVGYIKNVQNDGNIQALITQPNEIYQDILDQLASNNQRILDKIVIRPGVSKSSLN